MVQKGWQTLASDRYNNLCGIKLPATCPDGVGGWPFWNRSVALRILCLCEWTHKRNSERKLMLCCA